MSPSMDQNSWSFLFKRWSEDYENSQRLQQELTTLKQQHDCLLGQFQALQQRIDQGTRARPDSSLDKGCGTDAEPYENARGLLDSSAAEIKRLKNENQSLHRTLQRHEEQTANKNQSISKLNEELQTLTLENASLAEQRDQLMKRYEEITQQFKDLQTNVKMAHNANMRLQEQATEATQQVENLHTEMARIALIADKLEEVEVHHKELVASYEKQVHDMKQSLDTKDNENRKLRDELLNHRDASQKLRESNRYLTTTVANLQGMILHKLNGTHPPSGDANQAQQQRPRTDSSTVKPDKAPSDNTSTTIGNGKPSTHNPKGSGDKTTTQRALQLTSSATGKTNIQSVDAITMPLERRQAFAGVPRIVPSVADAGEKDLFERTFLKSTIGGAVQSLIVRITDNQTPLAKARRISTYLCPSLDHNPWCPAVPGEHGYMFVGLGREKDTFLEPQDYNVFVGLFKDKGFERRKYRYVGVYRAVRVSPLNGDEWDTLPETVRNYFDRTDRR
ncbi:hypothetical protein AX15_007176 [Amanita polypyramis BW_CC]|nr:hypothetical protein AX15_007176 [Amanita polypyramis BW_CC]